jgi:predicted RNase H-like HicB family nuclease
MKKSYTYLKLVEWNEEERCYIGSAPPLIGPCCHGEDETKVYRDLCRIVDEGIALYEEEEHRLPEPLFPPNKEFSGRFLLRIDPSLHKALALQSMRTGKTLDAYNYEKMVFFIEEPPNMTKRAEATIRVIYKIRLCRQPQPQRSLPRAFP